MFTEEIKGTCRWCGLVLFVLSLAAFVFIQTQLTTFIPADVAEQASQHDRVNGLAVLALILTFGGLLAFGLSFLRWPRSVRDTTQLVEEYSPEEYATNRDHFRRSLGFINEMNAELPDLFGGARDTLSQL